MKKEISGIELKYAIDELQTLVDAKVDKIFQPSKKEVILQLHLPSVGKRMLRILLKFIFVTTAKPESPQNPFGFCAHLRKHLENTRLRTIRQVGSERIVELIFEAKERKYLLIIELFAKGNIIFCDNEYNILIILESEKTRGRTLKGGVKYIFPEARQDLFKLKLGDFRSAIESPEDNISKTIATKLGLGGSYALEACTAAGIDPKSIKLDTKQAKALYDAVVDLVRRTPKANVIYEDGLIKDIVPFELEIYKDFKKEYFDSFNTALDSVFSKMVSLEEERKKTEVYEKEAEKLRKTMKVQEKAIKNLEVSAQENQRKGEMFYENYQLVKEVLTEINKAREKYSWKEIKAKLKGHKVVKEINEKTGEITIEI